MDYLPLPSPAPSCFLLNNAGGGDANEHDLKTSFIFTYAHVALIMQIYLKGFSFTVMEKLLLFWESFSFKGIWGT